jgi:hypothetical protein
MRQKLSMIAVFLLLFLAGCVPQGYWTKSDFSNDQWNRDHYECANNAQATCHYWDPRQNVIAGAICVQDQYNFCIRSKGYQWEVPR